MPENCSIALYGDLGAGKTTFIKGLARAWEIRETVTSPTFNIFTIYRGSRNLIHLDAYRITQESQLDDLMLDDFLIPPFCLAIEWPENLGSQLPADCWKLQLNIVSPGRHSISLK